MKKVFFLTIFIVNLSLIAHAETLSLSTYYPAPFGVYNQLRLVPTASVPTCVSGASGNTGLLWINNSNQLMMCTAAGVVSPVYDLWSYTVGGPGYVHLSTATNNVGIGTTTANSKLHIHNAAATSGGTVRSTNSGTGITATDGLIFEQNTAADGQIWNYENGYLRFGTNNAERVRINNAGNVGIGTTTANSKLHIHNAAATSGGTVRSTNSGTGITATDGLIFEQYTAADGQIWNYENGLLRFGTNNLERVAINNAGNVGIGGTPGAIPNTAVASPRLLVGDSATILPGTNANGITWIRGDLYVTTNNTVGTGSGNVTAHAFFYVSDENLKENIKPVSGLDTIMKLEGVKFNWKENGVADVGVTAQNVETVLPELVATNPQTKMKTVKIGNLVAPLIQAVKEQQAQIEALKKEIEELKARQF